MKNFSSKIFITSISILFGFLLLIVAHIDFAYEQNISIAETFFTENVLLLIIDSLPFLMGIFGFLIGMRQEKLDKRKILMLDYNALEMTVNEHALVSKTTIDGEITYVNQKFLDVLGYSEEELIGQNHRILKSDRHDKTFFQYYGQPSYIKKVGTELFVINQKTKRIIGLILWFIPF